MQIHRVYSNLAVKRKNLFVQGQFLLWGQAATKRKAYFMLSLWELSSFGGLLFFDVVLVLVLFFWGGGCYLVEFFFFF